MRKLAIFRHSIRRSSPFTLIEVLISFSLVVIALFPLIYPHTAIYREQIKGLNRVEMNHAVNLLFGELLRELYQQEIPLSDITEGHTFPIGEELLKRAGYEKKPPFTGSYSLNLLKEKHNDERTKSALLTALTFLMRDRDKSEKVFKFQYLIAINHNATNEGGEGNSEEESDEE